MTVYASEGLLYICFAILTGSLLLRIVPASKRPPLHVPDRLLLVCALAIPVLAFAPVHQVAALFAAQFDMTYLEMLKSVLLDIHIGKAWTWTLVGSSGLAVLLGVNMFRTDRHMPKIALFITILLVVWVGYGSHSASLSLLKGLVVHAAHFLGFTVWIGILFVVAWFSRSGDNWAPFLRWFSPTAIVAVVVTMLAGFTLMTFTTPQYVNAWMLPYGQMMLIKHLLLVPLLLIAYTNGFLYQRIYARRNGFNPVPWLRIESVVALLVLAATAVMGQQAPPHNVQQTLQGASPSPLFTALYREPFSPDTALTLGLKLESVLMLLAALVMAAGLLRSYRDNRPAVALLMGLLVAVFGYFAIMFAVVPVNG